MHGKLREKCIKCNITKIKLIFIFSILKNVFIDFVKTYIGKVLDRVQTYQLLLYFRNKKTIIIKMIVKYILKYIFTDSLNKYLNLDLL